MIYRPVWSYILKALFENECSEKNFALNVNLYLDSVKEARISVGGGVMLISIFLAPGVTDTLLIQNVNVLNIVVSHPYSAQPTGTEIDNLRKNDSNSRQFLHFTKSITSIDIFVSIFFREIPS